MGRECRAISMTRVIPPPLGHDRRRPDLPRGVRTSPHQSGRVVNSAVTLVVGQQAPCCLVDRTDHMIGDGVGNPLELLIIVRRLVHDVFVLQPSRTALWIATQA